MFCSGINPITNCFRAGIFDGDGFSSREQPETASKHIERINKRFIFFDAFPSTGAGRDRALFSPRLSGEKRSLGWFAS
jgi:hypothetical protein